MSELKEFKFKEFKQHLAEISKELGKFLRLYGRLRVLSRELGMLELEYDELVIKCRKLEEINATNEKRIQAYEEYLYNHEICDNCGGCGSICAKCDGAGISNNGAIFGIPRDGGIPCIGAIPSKKSRIKW